MTEPQARYADAMKEATMNGLTIFSGSVALLTLGKTGNIVSGDITYTFILQQSVAFGLLRFATYMLGQDYVNANGPLEFVVPGDDSEAKQRLGEFCARHPVGKLI